MKILRLPGVYRPRSDTSMLVDALLVHPVRPGGSILELCTGTGAVGLALADRGHAVTAVDLSRRATWSARLNARLNRLPLDVRRGDLFAPVHGLRFDAIVANPPYVPTPPEARTAGATRAWNAGEDGRVILDQIIDGVADHLAPGGSVYLVQSSLADIDATIERLGRQGFDASVLASRRGPLGPISAGRSAHLASRGLLPPGGDEELAVICGRSRTLALEPVAALTDSAGSLR